MTAKKKTLIELMLDAGIKPDDICEYNYIVCDDSTGSIRPYINEPYFDGDGFSGTGYGPCIIFSHVLPKNHKRTIVTKQQFIDAYNENERFKSLAPIHVENCKCIATPVIQEVEENKPADAATAIQPKPHGTSKPILGMVLADLTNRALEGKEKYGEPLKAGNGRNALWDAYQEALDLAMYLRQAIEEQGSK